MTVSDSEPGFQGQVQHLLGTKLLQHRNHTYIESFGTLSDLETRRTVCRR